MSPGTYGQQALDTIRDAHHFLHAGFGDFYTLALVLSAVYAGLWLAKQARNGKRKRAAKKRAAAKRAAKGRQRRLRAVS